MLVRGDRLSASQILQDKVLSHPKIKVRFHTEVTAFNGKGGKLTSITTKNNVSDIQEEMYPAAVFVFIGLLPNTAFLKTTTVQTNKWGFINTGHDLVHTEDGTELYTKRDPAMLESSVPGIFAAGDVRAESTKQVASAAGEGATAALLIREYLKCTMCQQT
jgi:thioredoxin reductase (NADPH)